MQKRIDLIKSCYFFPGCLFCRVTALAPRSG
jgi:hypothetical protein